MMMLLTACATTPNDNAGCEATKDTRRDTARALLASDDLYARRAVNTLLDELAAWCDE